VRKQSRSGRANGREEEDADLEVDSLGQAQTP
jgi:hypothetical protein